MLTPKNIPDLKNRVVSLIDELDIASVKIEGDIIDDGDEDGFKLFRRGATTITIKSRIPPRA